MFLCQCCPPFISCGDFQFCAICLCSKLNPLSDFAIHNHSSFGFRAVEKHKLCICQLGIHIRAIHLGAVQLVGEYNDGVFLSTAGTLPVGVVGEFQVRAVFIAGQANLGVFIQHCVVENHDVAVLRCRVFLVICGRNHQSLQIVNGDGETIGLSININSIFSFIEIPETLVKGVNRKVIHKINLESRLVLVVLLQQGQPRVQGIMERISIGVVGFNFGCIRHRSNQFKGDIVSDIPVCHVVVTETVSMRLITLCKLLIVDLLQNRGDIAVLGLHGHVAQHLDDVIGGGVGIALQAAVLVFHQVVAGGEAFDDIGASRHCIGITGWSFGKVVRHHICKGCCGFSIGAIQGGGDSGGIGCILHPFKSSDSCICFQSGQQFSIAGVIHAAAPGDVTQHGAFGFSICCSIAGHGAGEDLVGFVGVAGLVVMNGDGIILRGGSRNDQRQQHDQGQQDRCQFSCFFHDCLLLSIYVLTYDTFLTLCEGFAYGPFPPLRRLRRRFQYTTPAAPTKGTPAIATRVGPTPPVSGSVKADCFVLVIMTVPSRIPVAPSP